MEAGNEVADLKLSTGAREHAPNREPYFVGEIALAVHLSKDLPVARPLLILPKTRSGTRKRK